MNTGLNPSAPIAFPSIPLSKVPEGGNASKAGKTILIVDDNRVYVKATSMILRNAGYDVLSAFDGATAVSTVRQSKLDLILLDLNFPPDVGSGGGVAWDGPLIISWLRRINEDRNIPIIAITASDLATCQDRCLKAGVLKVFSKPVDHEILLSTIREALSVKV
jgi:CheY-like chemotaxis protein